MLIGNLCSGDYGSDLSLEMAHHVLMGIVGDLICSEVQYHANHVTPLDITSSPAFDRKNMIKGHDWMIGPFCNLTTQFNN
ncbi:hypothetical protein DPMN_071338 [Dreissena polymorpha]|uniref:Uncharacterized protein n=1 Tax=Dreissena polymorpha TaxID=45954 RepID=A0A9D3Z6J4_DREPO|nr:hypothetical protein DPMN_071338 [Dreissena polymorpha]